MESEQEIITTAVKYVIYRGTTGIRQDAGTPEKSGHQINVDRDPRVSQLKKAYDLQG